VRCNIDWIGHLLEVNDREGIFRSRRTPKSRTTVAA